MGGAELLFYETKPFSEVFPGYYRNVYGDWRRSVTLGTAVGLEPLEVVPLRVHSNGLLCHRVADQVLVRLYEGAGLVLGAFGQLPVEIRGEYASIHPFESAQPPLAEVP